MNEARADLLAQLLGERAPVEVARAFGGQQPHVAAQALRRSREGWQFIAIGSEAGFMLSKAGEVAQIIGRSRGAAAVKY